jgi:hypothetical protein
MDNEWKRVNKEVCGWLKTKSYKEIRAVARPNKYPWNMWLAQWSTYLAILLLKVGVTPNQVTFSWFLLGIFSSFLLWKGMLLLGILFILLYNFTWYLDYVDGDMARIINYVSPKYKQNVTGAWLDKFAYSTHKSLVLLGIGVGLFNTTSSLIYLVLGFIPAYFLILDNFMKVRVTETLAFKKKYDSISESNNFQGENNFIKSLVVPFLRPEPISILTIAILFGFLNYLLYFYVILYISYFLMSYIKINKRLSNIYR